MTTAGERRDLRAPAALALAVAAIHAAMAAFMSSPLVHYDEFGYFGMARWLAGDGVPTGLKYHPGYSFLLTPIWWLTDDPETVYVVTLVVVNALLAAVTALVAWYLAGALRPGLPTRRRLLVVATASLYPSWLLYSNLTWSENAIVPVTAGVVALFARGARTREPAVWAAAGVLAAYGYLVHPRGIVLVPGVVLAAALVLRPWRSSRAALAASVASAAGGLVAARAIVTATNGKQYAEGELWHAFGLDSVPSLLLEMAGQAFYVAAATYGLVPLGLVALARLARGAIAGTRDPAAAAALVSLVLLAGTFLVSTLSLRIYFRADHLIYGRYVEGAMLPALIVGLAVLAGRPLGHARSRIVLPALLIGALGAVVAIGRSAGDLALPRAATNILGVAAGLRLDDELNPFHLALLYAACTLALGAVAASRHGALLAPALLAGVFAVGGVALHVALFVHPSEARAQERMIARRLQGLSPAVGFTPRCVVDDRPSTDAWSLAQTRYLLPIPFPRNVPPMTCDGLFVTGRPDDAFRTRHRGARVFVRELRSRNVLWVLPGSLQTRLAAAGLLEG